MDIEETLTPVYPATEGLTQQRIRSLCEQALQLLNDDNSLQELLPSAIRQKYRLSSLMEAVRLLHQPPPKESVALLTEGRHPAQRRLAFEELLAHNLSLQKIRKRVQSIGGFAMPATHQLTQQLLSQLPFTLTGAQQRVFSDVSQDMATATPMLRLVQGDVGSGKTVVAALAALQAVEKRLSGRSNGPYRNFGGTTPAQLFPLAKASGYCHGVSLRQNQRQNGRKLLTR